MNDRARVAGLAVGFLFCFGFFVVVFLKDGHLNHAEGQDPKRLTSKSSALGNVNHSKY